MTTHYTVLINRKFLPQYNNTERLKRLDHPDTTFTVLSGHIYNDVIQDIFPHANYILAEDMETQIAALNHGEADAILYNEWRAKEYMLNFPEMKVHFQNITLHDTTSFFGVAVSPDDRRLREWINIYIHLMKDNGYIDSLIDKYT